MATWTWAFAAGSNAGMVIIGHRDHILRGNHRMHDGTATWTCARAVGWERGLKPTVLTSCATISACAKGRQPIRMLELMANGFGVCSFKYNLDETFVCTLACFFEGVVGDTCCAGIFEKWSNFATNIFPKVEQIGPRVPQGRPKSVQGVPPRGSEQQVVGKIR